MKLRVRRCLRAGRSIPLEAYTITHGVNLRSSPFTRIMVRRSVIQDEPDTPIAEPIPKSTLPTLEEDRNRYHWGLSSEDAFEDPSISSDAGTPGSSMPSLSLRRSSASRRKSTSTRSSYERDSTYYDASGRSSFSESNEEMAISPGHLSLPAQQWRNNQESVRRTMSVPITIRANHQDADVPAPLNPKRRTFSLEKPQKAASSIEHAGNVNESWYVENALLHGLDPMSSNQLQIYLLGIPKGHIPLEVDLPASYVVFLPSDRDGTPSASTKVARYRCRYPDCEVKWRDEDEHK